MIVKTASGSIYEIDRGAHMVRRVLKAKNSEAARPGEGEWRQYIGISEPTVGFSLRIIWNHKLEGTETSPVVEIAHPEEFS